MCQFLRYDNQILLTDLGYDNRICILIVISIVALILRYKLLGLLHTNGQHRSEKLHHPLRMRLALKQKINPILLLLNLNHLFMGIMLQYKLLEPEERLLMLHMLPDLHGSHPRMRRELLLTVVALQVLLDELDDEGLLDVGEVVELFGDGDFYLYAAAVGFGPDEASVDYF